MSTLKNNLEAPFGHFFWPKMGLYPLLVHDFFFYSETLCVLNFYRHGNTKIISRVILKIDLEAPFGHFLRGWVNAENHFGSETWFFLFEFPGMATGHTFGTKFSDFNFYLEAQFGLKKPVFLRFFALGACGGYTVNLSDLNRNRALLYVNYPCKSVEWLTFFLN